MHGNTLHHQSCAMDSDSNNRDDNAGKRCNHEATNGYHAVAVAIGNSNSSFNDGADDDDDAKMPASDAYHESASVVQYLIELDTTTLEAVDEENNTALHYACRGAKFETITLLLEKYGAVSVSQRNAQKKLPIDLLWESSEVVDRECVEYMGSIFQLLKAYPEIVVT